MRNLLPVALTCLTLWTSSCAATGGSAGPPDQVATEIVRALDEGRTDEAHDLFDDASGSEAMRQQLYPLLYEAAQDRYVRGDATGSTELLRFLSKEYPSAQAVQRALLSSLFLLRGEQDSPTPELTARLEKSLKAVRAQSRPPVWTDLVETQLLIDQGRLTEALASFERFAGAWDGQPEAIAIYVDDIERYLASH